jgi:hypothetical protein
MMEALIRVTSDKKGDEVVQEDRPLVCHWPGGFPARRNGQLEAASLKPSTGPEAYPPDGRLVTL